MKNYITPLVELLALSAEDVITTSITDYTSGTDTPLVDSTDVIDNDSDNYSGGVASN